MDRWFNVNADARVWAGHADVHKMGWMRAGSGIRAIQEYSGSYRFKEVKGPEDLIPLGNGYNEYWIRKEDVSILPYSDPVPAPDDEPDEDPGDEPDTNYARDARLGAAVRLIRAEGGGVVFPASD